MRSILIFVSSLALTACGSVSMKSLTDSHEIALAKEISSKYLPYAIMASDVYKTQGSGSYIGDKINSINKGNDSKLFDDTFSFIWDSEECKAIRKKAESKANDDDNNDEDNDKTNGKKWLCKNVRYRNYELSRQELDSEGSFTDGEKVKSTEDCDTDSPEVRVSALTERGWRRTVEIEKYALPKSWRIFVPDLAIEVWEKNHLISNDPQQGAN